MFQTYLLEPIANGLVIFYRIFGGNLGLAIVAFSIFIRFVLSPVSKTVAESTKKVNELKPRVEKLKKKYKDDKSKFLQAQTDLYREKGVNPAGGCLPTIINFLVIIALFRVFTRVLVPGADLVANFNELLYDSLKFAEGETVNTKFLYLDVSKPDTLSVQGLPFSLPGPFLLLAAFIQMVSVKITQPYMEAKEKAAKKTKQVTDDTAAMMQQTFIYSLPIMTIWFGYSFSSGLIIYWFLFSLFQAIQQYRSSGWGGLTPWIKRFGLLKSPTKEK